MPLDYKVPPNPERDYDFEEIAKDVNPDDSEPSRMRRLVAKIKKDDQARSQWRDKQGAWNRMRSVGIGRVSLPFRGASDFHFPLSDTFIEKLKPFYYQQALQPDPLCSFIPMTEDAVTCATHAAQWFDYRVRTKSNFRKALPVFIDLMLERGQGIVKITWDHDRHCLCYESIDPVNFIVPPATDGIESSERCCHVLFLNRSDYLRRAKDNEWETDPGWIKSCLGPRPDTTEVDQDKQWTTGVNFDEDDELMVLWEVYSRDKNGNILIDLLNPNKPDQPARPCVKSYPYRHGKFPFVIINYEIKSRGFYENRGICEIIGQFEQELCKLENEKLDYMTYVNRPIFTHKGATINAQNLKMAPGQIIGNELQAVQFPTPPISFDDESKNIRSIAEQRIGMPDFGLGRSNDFSQPRTKAEAEMLQQYNNQGVDLRGRVFDEGLHEIYEQSWKLELQYNSDNLQYTYRHEFDILSKDVLKDMYVLEPNGNPDGYDKNAEIKRLVDISGIPGVAKYTNPEKFAKKIFELADVRYLRELFMPGGIDQNQYEKQADEIGNMLNGFEIQVQPDDDPAAHMKALLEYFEFCDKSNVQVPLLPSLRMYKHFLDTYQQYSQVNPAGFKADKQILDNAKGRVEKALPIIQQALQDGMPPMASLQGIESHLQQIHQQLQPPPAGPLQTSQAGPPAAGSPQFAAPPVEGAQ